MDTLSTSKTKELISRWWDDQQINLNAQPKLLILHEHLYFAALNSQNASSSNNCHHTHSSLRLVAAIEFLSHKIDLPNRMIFSIFTEAQMLFDGQCDQSTGESMIEKITFRMAVVIIAIAQNKIIESKLGTVPSGFGFLVYFVHHCTPEAACLFPTLAIEEEDPDSYHPRFVMTEEDEAQYTSEFSKLTNGIEGSSYACEWKRETIMLEEAMRCFVTSGLSQQELLEMIYLVKSAIRDVSLENISKEEFGINMHLVICRTKRGLGRIPLEFPFALFSAVPDLVKVLRGCKVDCKNLQQLTTSSSLITLLEKQLDNTSAHFGLAKHNCGNTEQIMYELRQTVSNSVQQLRDYGMNDILLKIDGTAQLTMTTLNEITDSMRIYIEQTRKSIQEGEALRGGNAGDVIVQSFAQSVQLVHELFEMRQKRKALEALHDDLCEQLWKEVDNGTDDTGSARVVSDQVDEPFYSDRAGDCTKQMRGSEVMRNFAGEDSGTFSPLSMQHRNPRLPEGAEPFTTQTMEQGPDDFFNVDRPTFPSAMSQKPADVVNSQNTISYDPLIFESTDFDKLESWGEKDFDEPKTEPQVKEEVRVIDAPFFDTWEGSTLQTFGERECETASTIFTKDLPGAASMQELRSVKEFVYSAGHSIEYDLPGSAFADTESINGIPLDAGNDIDLNVFGEKAPESSEEVQKSDESKGIYAMKKDNTSVLLATPSRDTSRLSERLRNRATLSTPLNESIDSKIDSSLDRSDMFEIAAHSEDGGSSDSHDRASTQTTYVKKTPSFECDFGDFARSSGSKTFGSFEPSTNSNGLEFAAFQAFEDVPFTAFDSTGDHTLPDSVFPNGKEEVIETFAGDAKLVGDTSSTAFGSFEIDNSGFESFGDFVQAPEFNSPAALSMETTSENWSSFATYDVPSQPNISKVNENAPHFTLFNNLQDTVPEQSDAKYEETDHVRQLDNPSNIDDLGMDAFPAAIDDMCVSFDDFQEPQELAKAEYCQIVPDSEQQLQEVILEASFPDFTNPDRNLLFVTETSTSNDSKDETKTVSETQDDKPLLDEALETQTFGFGKLDCSPTVDLSPSHESGTFGTTALSAYPKNDFPSHSDDFFSIEAQVPSETFGTTDEFADFGIQRDSFPGSLSADAGFSSTHIVDAQPEDPLQNETFAESISFDTVGYQMNDLTIMDDNATIVEHPGQSGTTLSVAVVTNMISEDAGTILGDDESKNVVEDRAEESGVLFRLLDEVVATTTSTELLEIDRFDESSPRQPPSFLNLQDVPIVTEREDAQPINSSEVLYQKVEEPPDRVEMFLSWTHRTNTGIPINISHSVGEGDDLYLSGELLDNEYPPDINSAGLSTKPTDTNEDMEAYCPIQVGLSHMRLKQVVEPDKKPVIVENMVYLSSEDETKAIYSVDLMFDSSETLTVAESLHEIDVSQRSISIDPDYETKDSQKLASSKNGCNELLNEFERRDDQPLLKDELDATRLDKTAIDDEDLVAKDISIEDPQDGANESDVDASATLLSVEMGNLEPDNAEPDMKDRLSEIDEIFSATNYQEDTQPAEFVSFTSIDDSTRVVAKNSFEEKITAQENVTSENLEFIASIDEHSETDKVAKSNVHEHTQPETLRNTATQEVDSANSILDDEAFERLMEQAPLTTFSLSEDDENDNFEFEHDQLAEIMQKQSARKSSNPFANKSVADVAKAVDELIGHCEYQPDDESSEAPRKLTLEEVSKELELMTLDVS